MLVDALVLEHVCDPDLCRDRGVVRTRLPERFIALHPLPADQNILQGVVQGVAHMKLPGYIRRRHHDCERLSVGIHLRMEIASVEPVLIDPVLHAGRIVCLDKFSLTHSLLSPVRCPFRKALHLSAGSCTAVRSSALSGKAQPHFFRFFLIISGSRMTQVYLTGFSFASVTFTVPRRTESNFRKITAASGK